jgi:hypothetical protein
MKATYMLRPLICVEKGDRLKEAMGCRAMGLAARDINRRMPACCADDNLNPIALDPRRLIPIG